MIRLMIAFFVMTFSLNLMAAECGLFRVVKGKVTYKQQGKSKFRKARINKKICQGDTVKTEVKSRTKIVMADKNELNISPDSQVLIEVYQNASNGDGKVLLEVVYGKVRSNVKQKYKDSDRSHYRVKTKSAVAGVRGTEFMASFDQSTNESRVVTFEGEVMVGEMRGGQFVPQVSVKPGQFTSNRPGTNPHPAKEVPAKEFAQMNQETGGGDSGRDVSSGDAAKSTPNQKEDGAKNEGDNTKKPGASPAKPDKKPTSVKKPAGPKGADTAKPKVGSVVADSDSPKQDFPGDGNAPGPQGDAPGRDIASIESGDPMGLPPPSLDDMPTGDGFGTVVEPPRIPRFDPMVETTPQCLTCNDAVINQTKR